MLKYFFSMYRKHKYPYDYCAFDGCLSKLSVLRSMLGIDLCQDCQIDLMTDQLEYEIYEYLEGA